MVLGALVFVPLGLIDAVLDEIGSVDSGTDSLALIVAALTFAGFQILTTLLGEVFYSGAVSSMLRPRGDRQLAPGRVLRSLPFRRLIAADIVFTALVSVGLLALIAPGIVLFTWFGLIAPVIEIEGRGLRSGFARSRALVRGNFWRVLAVLGPVTIASDALISAFTGLAHDLLGHSFAATWAGEVFGNVLASPLYAVPAVLMTLQLIELKSES